MNQKSLDKKKTKELDYSKLVEPIMTADNVIVGYKNVEPKKLDWDKEFKNKVFGIIVDYVHDDLFKTDNCVKSIDELYDWIETHTKKKVEDKIERVKGLKVGEAEGWDFFFGSKKQCCPGDDYSDIYNQAISDVLKIMEEK